jgi:hypothetical protein
MKSLGSHDRARPVHSFDFVRRSFRKSTRVSLYRLAKAISGDESSRNGVIGSMLLCIGAVWCLAHFSAFVIMRGQPLLASERGIFRFHIASFATLAILLAAFVAAGASIGTSAGALSLHGIYSLSFLELWSLSEGGFSVTALLKLFRKPLPRASLVAELAKIGQRKKDDRIRKLVSGGLISGDAILTLTERGRWAANAVRLLRSIANFKDVG